MEGDAAVAKADDATRTRKLPPLDIRPFERDDYSQVRQLIADSAHLAGKSLM